MTSIPFGRLMSMPTFEGLRILRTLYHRMPEAGCDELMSLIRNTDPNAPSYDLEAAIFLHDLVPYSAPHSGVHFYRACLHQVLLMELPEWAKLITLGRGRFIKRLKAAEYRDVRSLFRQAKLLDDPPSIEDVEWWDAVQAHVRQNIDADKMKRAREAELLTISYERDRLAKLGLPYQPVWMAIDDNTVGYDVLSFNAGHFGPLNKLIEVKSSIASPLRFYLTRNEWEQAEKFGEAYVFHVWDMQKKPPALYELSVADVSLHVPTDNADGKWSTVVIPLLF